LNHHGAQSSSQHHPFGPELAQVSEIAEEYGIKEKVNEADTENQDTHARGLLKFQATDYLSELQSLHSRFFCEETRQQSPTVTAAPAAAVWI